MNVAKSLRSGRPPRRAPHATHFASHLCPSAHLPRGRSTPTDPMPLEAADASSPLQGWQASRGLRRSRDCFGIRTTRTQLEDRPHAPWRRSLRRGRLCVGSSPFWRVRQPSRDFPVSRSEPVPTGASHYTRRLCSSAQRAPQRLWVVKNGYVPRPPRVSTPARRAHQRDRALQ